MSSTTVASNVDVAVRAQLDYYGAGRYDLAEQMVTADYVDHEAPPGTPSGPEGANAVLGWLRGAFNDLASRERLGPPRTTPEATARIEELQHGFARAQQQECFRATRRAARSEPRRF